MESALEWFIAGAIETQYLSFLVRESKCMPWGGMVGVCRMVIGCIQPSGWKITSASQMGTGSLSGGGSLGSGIVCLH